MKTLGHVLILTVLLNVIQGCAYSRESYTTGESVTREDGSVDHDLHVEESCLGGLLVPMIPIPCSWVSED